MARFATLFQADKSASTLFVLFVPSADRDGKRLGAKAQDRWVRTALRIFGTNLRGATALPRGWGVWRDDARGGRLVWDRPILIQCFTNEDDLRRHGSALREFMIELGTKTNQGAVGFVIDRTFYEIDFP